LSSFLTLLRCSFALAACAALIACGPLEAPARQAPLEFRALSSNGPLSSASLRGKTVWLSFSYVQCPDAVPRQLAALTPALAALSEEERARVQPLLISVDPDRDDPHALARYAAYFHPQLASAVADKAELARLAQALGAKLWQQPPRPDGQYAVVHSVETYVIDASGRLHAVLPEKAGPAEFKASLKQGR